ncbi:hypothetical protein CLPU_5c01790 [Gottschalkia purinilytica]|uniref:SipL SPOCS domain-containing protein n=1 Tax=Gottschalkia purinilytica TaxID=1503 RepID=A0A0L0WBP6_GOTPU|nr:hypothetical protein [Gottschalkia purinilytica]KNF08872.1 hypothetical protein CLPU_5c01790 [Gottschalkia purinilytica]
MSNKQVTYRANRIYPYDNHCRNSVVSCNSSKKSGSSKLNNCVNVESRVIDTCNNIQVQINPITTGAIVKIPVVLAKLTVQFNLASIIDLPEPALEIKDIKKKVKITQCLLLQDTNVLFIKGFVRKNIDYSTKVCSNKEGICGEIHHCTVDIPFECSTPVTFNGNQPLPIINNTSNEFEYFRVEELPNDFAEKDKLLSGDFSEFNQTSTEFFNELPFCELICSKIVEFDEFSNRTYSSKGDLPFEEKFFTKIEEKMVISLTLKILQKQQVAIGPVNS